MKIYFEIIQQLAATRFNVKICKMIVKAADYNWTGENGLGHWGEGYDNYRLERLHTYYLT